MQRDIVTLNTAESLSTGEPRFQKVRLQSTEEGPWYAPITHTDCIYIPNQAEDLPVTWITSITPMNQPSNTTDPNTEKVYGVKLQYSNQTSPDEIKTLIIYPDIKIQDGRWWINGKDTGQAAIPGITYDSID